MRKASWLISLGALVALAHSPRVGRACGGFFSEVSESEVVAMSDIRVLFVRQAQQIDQYVQVGYTGKAARFAWVYPIAGNPEVSAIDSSPFPALDEATRPKITITTPHAGSGSGGFGCGSDGASRGDTGQVADPKVKVWQSGQVGAFDYVVITATRTSEMIDWLNANGFAVPAATSPVLSHYLGLGWFFVAMKVSVSSAIAEVPSTTVIRMRYSASELRYPLKMVSLSPAPQTSIEIYVVSEGGVRPAAPFVEATIPIDKLVATSESTHNYEQLFTSALAGGQRALVREFSSNDWAPGKAKLPELAGRGLVLTRFRGVLPAGAMTEDLVFDPAPLKELRSEFSLSYYPGAQAGLPAPFAAILLLLLARAAVRRRRRR